MTTNKATRRPEPTPVGYRYTGDGAALYDVPARDIRPDEVEQFDGAALIASGLYQSIPAADPPPQVPNTPGPPPSDPTATPDGE